MERRFRTGFVTALSIALSVAGCAGEMRADDPMMIVDDGGDRETDGGGSVTDGGGSVTDGGGGGTDGGGGGTDGGRSRTDGGMIITPTACALPPAIDQGLSYERTLHVSTSGTPSGDGSMGSPFDTIDRALGVASPGTRILVAAGRYGAVNIGSRSGADGRPIAIVADGEVTIDAGGGVGVRASDASWIVVEGLTITNIGIHGMNIDDGGSFDTPAHHLVLRGITIAGAGSGGNNDCIKMSGVDDFWVLDSDVSGCNRGEIIDMVGCHRGVIHGNYFHDTVQNGVQTKGGSADTIIHGNVFENIPARAVNAGGSTDPTLTRPADVPYEAARIRVLSNIFVRNGVDGGAAVAYVGCDGCVVAHNTIVEPRTWVLRILQESTGSRFVPCRNGVFANNVIVMNAAEVRTIVNVGGGTAPDTFSFQNNLWYAMDQGGGWTPPFSGVPAETGAIVQRDPMMVNRAGGDYRLTAGSPAEGAARDLGMVLPADFDGRCYADPATVGAFEIP